MSLNLDAVFDTIVNVHWAEGGDRIMVIAEGLDVSPVSVMALTTPKASYAETEQHPAPVFGTRLPQPTDTYAIPNNPPTQFFNELSAATPAFTINNRGYVTVAPTHWVIISGFHVAQPTGQIIIYGPDGKIAKAIPKETLKYGEAIVSDASGTVYMQNSGPGGSGSLTKRSEGGQVIWTYPEPDTAYYDKKNKNIVAVDASGGLTTVYSLNGSVLATYDLTGGFFNVPQDTSKKGTVYAFSPPLVTPGIVATNSQGAILWSVPTDGVTVFDTLVAYGEDYAVAAAHQSFTESVTVEHVPPITTITTTVFGDHLYLYVFSAKTGGLVSKTLWTDSKTKTVVVTGSGTVTTTTALSYGTLAVHRGAYFPGKP